MVSVLLRIGSYFLFLISFYLIIRTAVYSLEKENYLTTPSHPQLQLASFPVDSLEVLRGKARAFDEAKLKVISFVELENPYCSNFIKNISRIDGSLHDEFDFIPAFAAETVSDSYIRHNKVTYPIFAADNLSISSQLERYPTLFFLNDQNRIIYSTSAPPEDLYSLERMLEAVLKNSKLSSKDGQKISSR